MPLRLSTTALRLLAFASLASPFAARELHVSSTGSNTQDGSAARPLQTISAAAALTQPGDTVIVHAGTYRERVTPPRGGTSDAQRIVYQAAPGETAVIKGSEVARGWARFSGSVWKLTLPNSFFGRYNPYKDLIAGDWFDNRGRPHHTGEVYLNGRSLYETHLLERVLVPQPPKDARDPEAARWTWFCESDDQYTWIYANFHDRDPNVELVEINVRDACFYPDKPGCDYITVRGFRMAHAATQWAPPTAEQIGLLGTHWSKGWIIEHNIISDSKCSGITLGKDRATGHNVWTRDPSRDGAIHYNEVIERALAAGWSREKIGSHIVRHNTISRCEQTGICGSLGAIFSTIERNHIHDIWTKRQFAGAEIAGIKLHGAIDTVIRHNRIHNAGRGLWLDWMTQGTRVTANLCYNNSTDDLFIEVSHGPCVVDHNLFLSPLALRDWSQGSAFAHNLFAGQIVTQQVLNRRTPYHPAHDTRVAALSPTPGGDNRFFNNVFVGGAVTSTPLRTAEGKPHPRVIGYGPWVYDARAQPTLAHGNAYLAGAKPPALEPSPLALTDPGAPRLIDEGAHVFLEWSAPAALHLAATEPVTTARLGRTAISAQPYENYDGSPLILAHDYAGHPRDPRAPAPGPFERPVPAGIKVW